MFILKSLQREGGDRKSGLDRSGCAIVASNRIRRDVRELEPACFSTEHAKIDVTFPLGKEHIRCLRATIQPFGFVYEGAKYGFDISIPEQYPYKPPTLTCTAPMYHPNMDPRSGRLYLALVERDWRPVLCLNTVLLALHLLFLEPDMDPAAILNAPCAHLYRTDAAAFRAKVRGSIRGETVDDVAYPDRAAELRRSRVGGRAPKRPRLPLRVDPENAAVAVQRWRPGRAKAADAGGAWPIPVPRAEDVAVGSLAHGVAAASLDGADLPPAKRSRRGARPPSSPLDRGGQAGSRVRRRRTRAVQSGAAAQPPPPEEEEDDEEDEEGGLDVAGGGPGKRRRAVHALSPPQAPPPGAASGWHAALGSAPSVWAPDAALRAAPFAVPGGEQGQSPSQASPFPHKLFEGPAAARPWPPPPL